MYLGILNLFKYYFKFYGLYSLPIFIDRVIRSILPSNVYKYLCLTLSKSRLLKNDNIVFKGQTKLGNNQELPEYYKKEILTVANQIVNHEFDFLGTEKISWGENFSWNYDIKSNYKWESKFYSSYSQNELMPGRGIDIKIPWELNRLHHLVALGQAYNVSKNKIYLDECMNQFKNWQKNNPLCYGINWTSTMEVSLRAVNLIVLLNILSQSKDFPESDKKLLIGIIIEHGFFIINNLEIGIGPSGLIAGNHYLANISALFIIGVSFEGVNDLKSWRKSGKKSIEDAINWMVNNDGFYFESSTNYHRFALELFLYPYVFGKINHQKFSSNYQRKLQMMADIILYLNTPGNTIPQIGDNDCGRYLILNDHFNWDSNDYRYLLSICSVIFQRGDYKHLSKSFPIELFWIFGGKVKNYFDSIISEEVVIKSKSFKESGLYVIRDDNKKDYALIKGHGKNNMMHGHAHNDILSIELWISGEMIFIDPGTYCYSSNLNLRDKFRSTKNHSTIMVNSNELNQLGPGAFEINWKTNFNCEEWIVSEDQIKFVGTHDAYIKQYGIEVKRTIIYNNSFWSIKDELIGEIDDSFNIENRWILSPSIKNIGIKDNKIILDDFIMLNFTHSKEIILYNTQYSPSYGVKNKTKALKNSFQNGKNYFSELKIISEKH